MPLVCLPSISSLFLDCLFLLHLNSLSLKDWWNYSRSLSLILFLKINSHQEREYTRGDKSIKLVRLKSRPGQVGTTIATTKDQERQEDCLDPRSQGNLGCIARPLLETITTLPTNKALRQQPPSQSKAASRKVSWKLAEVEQLGLSSENFSML